MQNPAKQSTPDALSTLGTILDSPMGRDAIHVAVMPVVAAHKMMPGQHVGLLPDGSASAAADYVGIVDPFLEAAATKGQRFWLFVYPRQITSLRHVWTHPTLADESPISKPVLLTTARLATPQEAVSRSKDWLVAYADSLDVEYAALIDHAKDYLVHGNHWSEGDRFEGERVPDEFWSHYGAVMGTFVKPCDRGSFFSCSC